MNDDMVLTAVKTPLMQRATSALLPGRLTVNQALQELQKIPPKDSHARGVLQQLERETSGTFDFLVVTQTGEVCKAEPSTTLQEITVPREIRTPRGLETVPTAAFEVQAYAPVGGNKVC
jgi:1-deoxy-D-xylulose 5-phosphate reductoisomerase